MRDGSSSALTLDRSADGSREHDRVWYRLSSRKNHATAPDFVDKAVENV
jgi:hypothetical protein